MPVNSEDTLDATELEVDGATDELVATEELVFTDELALVAVDVTELEVLAFTLLETEDATHA
jgi:hypothetical protein